MKYSQESHSGDSYHNMTVVLFTLLCVLICGSLALSPKAQTKTSDEQGVTPNTVPGRNGKIAFTSYRDGNNQIYTTEADGSNVQRLTNNQDDSFPKWSPDGTRIVFQSRRDGIYQIYVMNADGTNQTRLTNNPGTDSYPEWSPDSSRIAFHSYRDGNYQIYVMNADGTNQTRLTNNPEDDHGSPIFSPDGTRIAFHSGYTFGEEIIGHQIYVVNADGSNPVRLTNTYVGEVGLDWQALSLTSPSCPNPIDCAEFFVRQQYRDFLNREPEQQGLTDWLAILNNCPAGSIQCDRIEVSSGFFRSPEFRQRGYFPYRFYNVSLGRIPTFAEFMPDLARVSGFLTEAEMEHARQGFIQDFMSRPGFTSIYNELSNNDYVQKLFDTAGLSQITIQGSVQTVATMQQAMANEGKSRAQVLREIVESAEVDAKYYVQAFVVMQYFGYLRRDPDALYLDWITTMQGDPNNYRQMVNGFMNSIEYRSRFGSP